MHFAEPDLETKPGQRMFDVTLQDQTVLKGFDVVREAGAARAALVKEFKGVKATDVLTLSFTGAATPSTPGTSPIISGLEIIEESNNSGK